MFLFSNNAPYTLINLFKGGFTNTKLKTNIFNDLPNCMIYTLLNLCVKVLKFRVKGKFLLSKSPGLFCMKDYTASLFPIISGPNKNMFIGGPP